MADANDLHRLALAAHRRAVHAARRFIADGHEAAPEARRDTAVVRLTHDLRELAVLDQLAVFAAELKLVAMIVDRP